MPTINIYYSTDDQAGQVARINGEIKQLVAQELSVVDKQLTVNEVSVRLLKVRYAGMIADLEAEITAHAYEARVEKQDEICNTVRTFLKEKVTCDDARVWLLLPQLGHSWEQ